MCFVNCLISVSTITSGAESGQPATPQGNTMTNQVKWNVFGNQLQRQHWALWSRCGLPVERQVYRHFLGDLEDDWDDGPHDQTQRVIEQRALQELAAPKTPQLPWRNPYTPR